MGTTIRRADKVFLTIAIALALGVPFSSPLRAQTFAPVPAIAFTKPFAGADPLPQILSIANVGASFAYTVTSSTSSGGTWLSTSPGPGCCETAPSVVRAIVTTLPTLAVGSYSGQIVVTSSNLAASMTIPVTLTVTAAGTPFLDNLPGQMSFALKTGDSGLTSQDIQVRNAGTGTLPWTLTTSTSDGGNWLSSNASSGTAPSTVTVGVNVGNLFGGLIPKTFVGQLKFSTASSSTTVPVSVVVGANIFSQVNAINFMKVFGGANPLPQVLTIPSTGTNFAFVVASSTATGGSWLSVSPGPGCCENTPNAVTATVNASPTLAVGTYTGQIVVSASNDSMSITVPVTLTVAPAGGTFFDNLPGQMAFALVTNGTSITSQDIEMRNGGSGTLSWSLTATTSDARPWLTVSAPSGTAPSIVSVGVIVANLPNGGLIAGTFVGELVFDSTAGRVTVPVSVVVGANVFSQVNPIDFTKVFGGANPLPQTLTIPSTGTNFAFTVTSSTATGGSWLTVSPGPGCCESTPNTITATVNASPTLAVGTYTGQIVVTASTGSMAITVPVTLTVAPGDSPFFDNVPGQMSFSLVTAASNNPPAQVVQIRNGGPGALGWTLATTTSDGGNWLNVSALSGTAPSTVSVTVQKSNLPGLGLIAGTFVGELVFRTAGSSVTVPVSVVVGANILSQVNAINFTKVFGGANPLPQILTIPSTGANFAFTVASSTATGGSWLTVSPGPGCCESTPNTITATVNSSPTLAAGTYTGQIVVTTSNNSMSITVPVTLTVAPAGGTFFDNVPGQVSFFVQTASGNPAAQNVQIRNGGPGTLNWSVTTSTSDGGNWLTASAPSGTAPSTVTVGVVASALPGAGLIAGTFNGQLVFQAAGSSVTIPVSVVVGTAIFVQAGALNFSKAFGAANPLSQNVNIASGGTNFAFTVESATGTGGNWLSVSPGPGCCEDTPRAITASIIASPTLAAGTYTGQIVLISSSRSMAMTVPVTLTVTGQSGEGVTPSSGAGSAQAFTFTYTDPNGYQDISGSQIIINSTTSGAGACYILFGRGSNAVALADDAGTPGPLTTLGAPTVLQNSQCSVLASISSQSGSGNTVTLTLYVVFKPGFAGPKNVYTAFSTNGGVSSSLQPVGTFTATVNATPISAVSVTPAFGTGQAQVFTFDYFDPNGYPNSSGTQLLFSPTTSAVGQCYILFGRGTNQIGLADDTGSNFTLAPLGGQTVLQNSQCSVFAANSYQSGSGTNLFLTLFVAFKPAFAGAKNVYSGSTDNGGNRSAFALLGTWTVSATPPAVAVNSVSPSATSGPSNPLTFVFSDPSGFADISGGQVIVNPTLNVAASCYIQFARSGLIALAGDDGVTTTSATLGQATALQNSQCIVNAAASNLTGTGNYLSLTLFVTMKTAGVKNVYASVSSNGGATSGYSQVGTWNVTSPSVLSPVSVSPGTGAGPAGTTQFFTFTYSDPNGANDISGSQIILSPALQGAFSCYVLYGRGTNVIAIANDNASSFTNGTLGTAGTVQNSQCSIDLSKSFQVQTGNTVNLTLAVNFKPSYKGLLYGFSNVVNNTGNTSSFPALGTFLVQ